MENFITHCLVTYSPKNEKAALMVELAKKYNNLIIEDRIGKDAFLAAINFEINYLNKRYPRQKELKWRSYQDRIEVYFPSTDTNTYKESKVFYLSISKAKGIFRFSESIPETETDKYILPLSERTLMGDFKPDCE